MKLKEVPCTSCGRPCLGYDPEQEGYCPDCAGECPSHGEGVAAQQAEAQRDMEARHRIIQGKGGVLDGG